jgi:DNA-binding NarL/FixJ family response regulator
MYVHHVLVARSDHQGWTDVLSTLGSMHGVRVIGTPNCLADAEILARKHQPSLVISADQVGNRRAVPFMFGLWKHVPATRFLVVGDDYRHDELRLTSEAGISCYLYWDDFLIDLAANLRVAASGRAVLLSDTIAAAHLAAERYRQQDDGSMLDISSREIATLRGLVDGLTRCEIANQLGISTRTVERTIERLQERLDAPNSHALVMKAAQHGLIP